MGLKVKQDTIAKVLRKFPFRSNYNKKLATFVNDYTKNQIENLFYAEKNFKQVFA